MNLHDLWIGDQLKIKSNDEVVTFLGIDANNLAILKNQKGEILHLSAKDLELYTEPERPVDLQFNDEDKSKKKTLLIKSDTDTIDLHYDELIKYHHHLKGHVLDFQIEKCKEFIEQSMDKNKSYIRIISGKGEGKLNQAVQTLLKKYERYISLKSAHYDGASIDIWFKG